MQRIVESADSYIVTLKIVRLSPVNADIIWRNKNASATNTIPKSALVMVLEAAAAFLGLPADVIYLSPPTISITKSTIPAKPSATLTTLAKTLSKPWIVATPLTTSPPEKGRVPWARTLFINLVYHFSNRQQTT